MRERKELKAHPSQIMGKEDHTADLALLSGYEKQQWLDGLGHRLSEKLRIYISQWEKASGRIDKGQ